MIELLFRGKHGAKWIESNSIKQENESVYLLHGGIWTEIIPETLGRHTGINDRKHTQIFEGDIVSGIAYSSECVGEIVWINEIAGFGVKYLQRADAWDYSNVPIQSWRKDQFAAEIIGNVYDNPELLKGGIE